MKNVILKKLSFINFKGFKNQVVEFHEKETSIYGGNGVGKTTIFNGFMWLLFGKDSQDRKDYEVKRLVGGKSQPKVDAEVEGVINVDGREITLKRILVENWAKPRGQSKEVFRGNSTELFINDVPMKVSEYQIEISNIIGEDLFKMITNPSFFVEMKWQDQRAMLFELAGAVSNEDIASSNERYKELLDRITGKTLDGYKKELSAKKRKLKEALDNIQPRIDQTVKLMPENRDFAKIEKEIEEVEKQIESIDKAISNKNEAQKLQYKAIEEKQKQINDLKSRIQAMVHEANGKAKEDLYKESEERRIIESEIKSTEREIESLTLQASRLDVEIKGSSFNIDQKEKKADSLRNEWRTENSKQYVKSETGSITCPLYGFECGDPNANKCKVEAEAKAEEAFNKNKATSLTEIGQRGIDLNKEIESLQSDKSKLENNKAEIDKELQKTKSSLLEQQQKLEKLHGPTAPKEIKAEDLQECVALKDDISKLEKLIDVQGVTEVDNTELVSQKKELQTQLDELKTSLADKATIATYKKEIQSLENEAKETAQMIADIERDEDTVAGFTKAKITECERRINGLFKYVTFKLFDYTIDGNEFETCIPLIDGVPYGSVNTAGKVNAGLDIINALTKFYNTSAPIFIDSRESINQLIDTDSQIVNLIVSTDTQLTIK